MTGGQEAQRWEEVTMNPGDEGSVNCSVDWIVDSIVEYAPCLSENNSISAFSMQQLVGL